MNKITIIFLFSSRLYFSVCSIRIGIITDEKHSSKANESILSESQYIDVQEDNIDLFSIQCSISELKDELKSLFKNATGFVGLIELGCSETHSEIFFITELLGNTTMVLRKELNIASISVL